MNRVHVRVRNRGPYTVDEASVALYWTTHDGNDAAGLPTRLCQAGDSGGAGCWRRVETDVQIEFAAPYSGASVAGCPQREVPACPFTAEGSMARDEARIVGFDLPASLAWGPNERLALLAVAGSSDDPPRAAFPPATGDIVTYVAKDNNAALWIDSGPEDGTDENSVLAIAGIALVLLLLLLL